MEDEPQVIDSAASPAATDGTPPSSEAKQAVVAADSAPAKQVEKPETVSEALAKVAPEKVEAESTEEIPEAGTVKTEAEATVDEPAKVEDKTDGSLDIPYDKRPEWTAAIKALGKEGADKVKPILRDMMARETQLNQRVTQLQPLAAVTTELEAQCGGKEGFLGTRKLVRVFNDNPAESVPMLETLLADARKRAGLEISSPDLKEQSDLIDKKVADGLLESTEGARQKRLLIEAETGRATGKRVTQQVETEKKQQEARAAQAVTQAKFEAISSWEANARKTNPDFGNVTPLDDPKHGESVGDQVFDAICLKFQNSPNATADQLVQEAERVLKLAKSRLNSPALRQSKPVTSQGSSVTAKPNPKTLREALDAVPAERTA